MKFTAASRKKDRYATSLAHFACISTQATPQGPAENLDLEVSRTAEGSYVKCHGSLIRTADGCCGGTGSGCTWSSTVAI